MFISGPAWGLIKLLGRDLGKKMGKSVTQDVRAANKLEWTLTDKIKELQGDSGLSYSYLKQLAAQSSDKSKLEGIREYLADPHRVTNLTPEQWNHLARTIADKLSVIDRESALTTLVDYVREYGPDIFH